MAVQPRRQSAPRAQDFRVFSERRMNQPGGIGGRLPGLLIDHPGVEPVPGASLQHCLRRTTHQVRHGTVCGALVVPVQEFEGLLEWAHESAIDPLPNWEWATRTTTTIDGRGSRSGEERPKTGMGRLRRCAAAHPVRRTPEEGLEPPTR